MDAEVWRQWLPIGISVLSLILSSLALGWNVYRDIVLKARVRVRFAVVSLVTPGQRTGHEEQFLRIGITNHGPGTVTVEMIAGRMSPWWRSLLRIPRHFVILNDYTNPLNPKLPNKLQIGDNINLLLPYNEKCLLSGEATHIGVTDSFGRTHFAPSKDLAEARGQFAKDFPSNA
jgi:hypothetical protein